MKAYSYLRFSTLEQEMGDSTRRQIALRDQWLKEHGISLDETLTMQDRGISAFKGLHKIKGVLGEFFKQVKAGAVPKGSLFIVESLDRLSRQQVSDALRDFLDLISAGITIVTLEDRMEYSKASVDTNFGQLSLSIGQMARAYGESARKSQLGKANWEGKRIRIEQKKLTAMGPAWLELNQEKTKFYPIPQNAAIIRKIFELKLKGIGSETIARMLNQDKTLRWKPKERLDGKPRKKPWNGWTKGYIAKILRNRAVFGEFQLKADSKPVGDPIAEYFPVVVKEETFYAVQKKLKENIHHGGRTGVVSNLFGHIARCGYCGGPMQLRSKNKTTGEEYLVCDRAKRGLGCHYITLRYPPFEKLVLKYAKGLNVYDLLPGAKEKQKRLLSLQSAKEAVEGKLLTIEKAINNLGKSIDRHEGSDKALDELNRRLSERTKEKERLEGELTNIEQEIQAETVRDIETGKILKGCKELFSTMDKATGEERTKLRFELRTELRRLIRSIKIYPGGRPIVTPQVVQTAIRILEKDPYHSKKDLPQLRQRMESNVRRRQYQQHQITFKSSLERTLDRDGLTMEYDPRTDSYWKKPKQKSDDLDLLELEALFLYGVMLRKQAKERARRKNQVKGK